MDYYKDTPPLEFISDVYDIMKDGDCLTPEKLNADVVDMLGKYLSAQQAQADVCPQSLDGKHHYHKDFEILSHEEVFICDCGKRC